MTSVRTHPIISRCKFVHRFPLVVIFFLAAMCCWTTALPAAEIGARIDRFELPDVHGRTRELGEWAEKPLVVVAFLGTECPLSRQYAARLQELSEHYAERGVEFVGIDANAQDSLTDMSSFANQFGIRFPLLKDRDQSVADKFGAVRNPEVFVLDKDRSIRYRGRIDDQYGLGSSSGYARTQVKVRNLAEALDELLAGKQVSQSVTQATGCLIGRTPKSQPGGEVTYAKHIAAMMQNHCVACHRPGQIGPFALTDYEEVAGWGAMIKEVVTEGRMPPWSANPKFGHFTNDARLSDREKTLIYAWVDHGCPQGDLADLPAPRSWKDGWQIAEPHQIVRMEKPFTVPAEGVVDYQNVLVDPGWTEDKWIQAAEVRPGNRAVVHHIIATAVPPGATQQARAARRDAKDSATREGAPARPARTDDGELRGIKLTAYVPGRLANTNRPGVAMFVPAGSKIAFQLHYTPNGKEQDDQSYIGFVFADPKTIKKRLHGGRAGNSSFVIPPRADNHEVVAEVTMSSDKMMLWMSPHMHLRGKSFRYEAHYLDGTSEILLDVPKYDFNWQITYELAEPKPLPKGTRLVCTAHFDNSDDNPANPDPTDTVRFGPQTWHEMMIGWYATLSAEDDGYVANETSDDPALEGTGNDPSE